MRSWSLGLGLTLAIVCPVAGQSAQDDPLRDQPVASDPDAPYQAQEQAFPVLRLPLPLMLFEWPLPPEAYPTTPEPATTPEPDPTPETPVPDATPQPDASPEPPVAEVSPQPTPTASPVADPEPELGTPISGILYLADGSTPAADRLAVLVNGDTGRIVTTTATGPDGAFTFPPQPKGNYRVLVGRKLE